MATKIIQIFLFKERLFLFSFFAEKKISLFSFFIEKNRRELIKHILEKLDGMTAQLLSLNESFQMQMKQNDELQQVIAGLQKQNEQLQEENAALKEQNKLDRKHSYGSKSQKISARKRKTSLREEDKGDHVFG